MIGATRRVVSACFYLGRDTQARERTRSPPTPGRACLCPLFLTFPPRSGLYLLSAQIRFSFTYLSLPPPVLLYQFFFSVSRFPPFLSPSLPPRPPALPSPLPDVCVLFCLTLVDITAYPQHGQRPLMQFRWDSTFKDLLESCWAEDPRERPGFSHIHVSSPSRPRSA